MVQTAPLPALPPSRGPRTEDLEVAAGRQLAETMSCDGDALSKRPVPMLSLRADSGGSRPQIRGYLARHSDLISLGVPR